MSELSLPIVGQPTPDARAEGTETSQSWDLHGGPSLRVASSVSEPSDSPGFFAGVGVRHFVDTQNNFGLRLQFQRETTQGSEYFDGVTQYRGLLTLSKGKQEELLLDKNGRVAFSSFSDRNLHVGLAVYDNGNGFSIGSDLASQGLIYRPSGRFGIGGRLFASNHTFIPFDEKTGETDPLIGLVVGLDIRLFWDHTATAPRLEALSSWEGTYYFSSVAHRFGRTYATAAALGGRSAEAQEYTNELFGTGGNVTARLEGVPLINENLILGNGNSEAEDLSLQLKADSVGAVAAMTIGKGLFSLAALGLDVTDESHSMLSLGLSGLGELGHFGLARAFGLGRSAQRAMTEEEKKAAARNFFLVRSAVNILPFGLGWALSDDRAGQAVLTAGQQLFLSTTGSADPAETGWTTRNSNHLAYEWNTSGGGFLGYRGRQWMPGTHLFSEARLMGQAFPGGDSVQDTADAVTGRDGAREEAVAKTISVLGGMFDKELGEYAHFTVSGGLRTILMHGGPEGVQAGVGAQEGILFAFGKETRFEIGVDLAQDAVGGEFMFGVSPFAGISSKL